jgi:hypothetical protein
MCEMNTEQKFNIIFVKYYLSNFSFSASLFFKVILGIIFAKYFGFIQASSLWAWVWLHKFIPCACVKLKQA